MNGGRDISKSCQNADRPWQRYRVSHKFVLTFDVPRKEGKFYVMTFSYHAMRSSENV